MNLPGTTAGNWRWRCTQEMLEPSVFDRLRDWTSASGRSARQVNDDKTEAAEARS